MLNLPQTSSLDLGLYERTIPLKFCDDEKHNLRQVVMYGKKVRHVNPHGVEMFRFDKTALFKCQKCPYEQIFEVIP